ncbi:hypothetical protein R2R70_23060, partial [Cobetia sp. SIMBA_158]|uniref:hypothetical protein n=1 Tax=Cobetia sp. SIMBA_158 TaxID=3081617 RepID=UPI00398118CD
EVVASSFPKHIGTSYKNTRVYEKAVSTVWQTGNPLLFGPFIDPITLEIGSGTSKFHDEVTLLFLQPVFQDGVMQFVLA